eukprot:CAMPEP_0201602846 /NCGR_PEP_ID=MMETSP0492-20130828/3463_1 /ASSEMBLY_ACC=CAM_ASM_000837 /TAXON_ID=420259 /ORGANISM="Thalassiosira gravida, Strain GMp14c1" /LENGTH=502 /DNA_ID=CAMNT_0048066479 /DNA_START=63 /DNA_END=1571 /DNA_ORIENTATION=+
MSPSPKVKISITASHDGGNIEVISHTESEISTAGRTAKCTVTVHVKPDVYTELEKIAHMQYFSFRAFVSGLHSSTSSSGGENEDVEDGKEEHNEEEDNSIKFLTVQYVVANAHAVSYPDAWPGTTICYTDGSLESSDDASWRRNLSTKYVDGKLTWSQIHTVNGSMFFSYWPPYTYNRHLKLVADCSAQISTRGGICSDYNPTIESLAQTLEGREIECISIGNGKLTAWIQHRQHPGESMAEFFAEGFLHRLLGIGADGELDDATKIMLEQYRLYIVPCMCPDGAVLGHLRTNSVGANQNREWATVHDHYEAPTLERSPEVHAVLSKMDETGVDFFLDVHGDEELPYVFFSGAEKTPVWGDRIKHLHGYFISCFQRANSDVQKDIGYPPPDSEEAALKYMNVATNQVSNRFNCLGLTLEMPFKDCATNPDPERGFSPDRAKNLGLNLVEALSDVHPYLRAEGEFWSAFSEEDAYVVPTDSFKEEGFVMLKKRFYSDVRPTDA